MYINPSSVPPEAYADLVRQLCNALSSFIDVTSQHDRKANLPPPSADESSTKGGAAPARSDAIGLRDIRVEFGLRSSQVSKLRVRWGFPAPLNDRPLLFSRKAIELWSAAQPNRKNLAVALRLRRYDKDFR
jgi:hypothetical protein